MSQSEKIKLSLEDSRVAVIGLGIEGAALCDFLIGKVKSITVLEKLSEAVLRDKTSKELYSKIENILNNDQIEKIFGTEYLDRLNEFDIVFRSPSIYFADPKLLSAREAGVKVSSQIDLFFELCPCEIIGVTGTKGKGTTATLLTEIISEQFKQDGSGRSVYLAGNIGYPAVSLIYELKPHDLVVLELSNFQLADLAHSPHIAIVTNLNVDHLDYHKTVEEYHVAKTSIIKYQEEADFAILNAHSTFEQATIDKSISKKVYFSGENLGTADAVVVTKNDLLTVVLDPANRNIEICTEKNILLLGCHNLENIAAATLAADILGIRPDLISDVAKGFVGLTHRLELVGEIDGIKYINDSFATNPGPTIAAIKSFREPKILILGGSEKGADFDELAEVTAENSVKAVVLIGTEKDRIRASLDKANFAGKIIVAGDSIVEIVATAKDLAGAGDVVIFSPACASFDMFRNYKDRGDKFRDAVGKLSEEINDK
jgi:UDP-N-acetylmuramoylalanine--D-glutamate ligase